MKKFYLYLKENHIDIIIPLQVFLYNSIFAMFVWFTLDMGTKVDMEQFYQFISDNNFIKEYLFTLLSSFVWFQFFQFFVVVNKLKK